MLFPNAPWDCHLCRSGQGWCLRHLVHTCVRRNATVDIMVKHGPPQHAALKLLILHVCCARCMSLRSWRLYIYTIIHLRWRVLWFQQQPDGVLQPDIAGLAWFVRAQFIQIYRVISPPSLYRRTDRTDFDPETGIATPQSCETIHPAVRPPRTAPRRAREAAVEDAPSARPLSRSSGISPRGATSSATRRSSSNGRVAACVFHRPRRESCGSGGVGGESMTFSGRDRDMT